MSVKQGALNPSNLNALRFVNFIIFLSLDLVTLTNLRMNFTKLHTLRDTLLGRTQNDSLDKYYYALYEMVAQKAVFAVAMLANVAQHRSWAEKFSALPEWWVANLKVWLALPSSLHCLGAECRSDSVCGDQQCCFIQPGPSGHSGGLRFSGQRFLWILPHVGIIQLMGRIYNLWFQDSPFCCLLFIGFLGNGDLLGMTRKFTCVVS